MCSIWTHGPSRKASSRMSSTRASDFFSFTVFFASRTIAAVTKSGSVIMSVHFQEALSAVSKGSTPSVHHSPSGAIMDQSSFSGPRLRVNLRV